MSSCSHRFVWGRSGMIDCLLVEDDGDLREILADSLRSEGWNVSEASSLEEAKICLKSRSFTLVVTDDRLPDGSSSDVLLQAELSQPSETVLIVMSGDSELRCRPDSQKRKAHGFLTKPFRVQEFLTLSSDLLRSAAV
jgi:two-component system, NtrC family, response regulator PilR